MGNTTGDTVNLIESVSTRSRKATIDYQLIPRFSMGQRTEETQGSYRRDSQDTKDVMIW